MEQMAKSDLEENYAVRTYKKRYLVLFVVVFHIILISIQITEYSSISDVVGLFYGVSEQYVTFTSSVVALVYVLTFGTVNQILKKCGLRGSMLIVAALHTLAAIVKCFSVSPNAFFAVLLGQTLAATSLNTMLVMCTTIVSAWFPASEITAAKSLIMSVNPLGMGLSFILRKIVTAHNIEEVLRTFSWAVALASLLELVVIFIFVDEKPPVPPSFAEKEKTTDENWKILLCNPSYMLLVFGYSVISTLSVTLVVLMNQAVLSVFPQQEIVVSLGGFLVTFPGVFAALFGRWLDHAKAFRTWANRSSFSIVLTFFLLWASLWLPSELLFYAASLLLGIAFTSFLPVAPDVAVEITYPLSESHVIGLLLLPSQLLTFFAPPLSSLVISTFGTLPYILLLLIFAFISWIAILCIKWELKRHNNENRALLEKSTAN